MKTKRAAAAAAAVVMTVAAAIFPTPGASAAPGDPGRPVRLSSAADGPRVPGDAELTPDGTRVVFTVEAAPNEYELYSASMAGGPPILLSGDRVAGSSVERMRVTPDGSRVVFVADQEVDNRLELYSVPVAGGARTELSGPLVAGGDVSEFFSISPNSASVVYVADAVVNDELSLFAVDVDGTDQRQLNPDPGPGEDVGGLPLITADSSTVIYQGDLTSNGIIEVFGVPLVGGASNRLNPDLVAGGNVAVPLLSPDGNWLAYIADQEVDERFELYVRDLTGGADPVRVSGTMVPGGDVNPPVRFSPDSSRVVFIADRDIDGEFELFSVRTNGTNLRQLNAPLVAGGTVVTFRLTPDGETAVFVSRQDSLSAELFSTPITGGAITRLSAAIDSTGSVSNDVKVTADGSRVLYRSDQQVGGRFDLFVVSPTGGTPIELDDRAAGNGVDSFQVSPDNRRVVYLADPSGGDPGSLWSVPLSGGRPLQLSEPPSTGTGFAAAAAITPDGGRVSFIADPTIAMGFELFSVRTGYNCRGRAATIVGTADRDTLVGTSGPDVIVGLAGNDIIRSRGGEDIVCAGAGNDTVRSGVGDDIVLGQTGRDLLVGQGGNDTLRGGPGRDRCNGGPGTDTPRSCERP